MLAIKRRQLGLRTHPDSLRTPLLEQTGNGFFYQRVTRAATAHRGVGHDAANTGFGKFFSGCKAARIGHQNALQGADQMQGLGIRAIHVLKNTRLLDDKYFTAQLKHGVKLGSAQRVKGQITPFNARHTAWAGLSE